MGIAHRGSVSGRTVVALCLVAACSSATSSPDQPDAGSATIVPDGPITGRDAPPEPTYKFLCDKPAPAGSPAPVMPPMPAAGCPTLHNGVNALTSTGHSREFILVVPEGLMATEHPPVLFMWHWIGGSANSFLTKGEVQQAADQQRFIAVIPKDKGATIIGTSFDTRWPFDITQSSPRMTEEFTFFDDMLACVEHQYTINEQCISSVGVSAGALFTDQLAQARSQTLASFISLSGGTGATWIKSWAGAARKLPGVVLWGGDGPPQMDGNKDILGCAGIGMDFSVASRNLESELSAEGHFIVECRHNCGHVEPPLDPLPGQSKYAGMWEFALNHPYWLPAGQSPFLDHGMPPSMPAWCSIGAGTSTPRTGAGCPAAENPCVN
jgi:hypothetical protein